MCLSRPAKNATAYIVCIAWCNHRHHPQPLQVSQSISNSTPQSPRIENVELSHSQRCANNRLQCAEQDEQEGHRGNGGGVTSLLLILPTFLTRVITSLLLLLLSLQKKQTRKRSDAMMPSPPPQKNVPVTSVRTTS